MIDVLEFALFAPVFAGVLPPQPRADKTVRNIKVTMLFLNIILVPYLNIVVPV